MPTPYAGQSNGAYLLDKKQRLHRKSGNTLIGYNHLIL
jgi:hypothetical protein